MTPGTVLKSELGGVYEVVQADPVRVRHRDTGITSFVDPGSLARWRVIRAGAPIGLEGLTKKGNAWVRE